MKGGLQINIRPSGIDAINVRDQSNLHVVSARSKMFPSQFCVGGFLKNGFFVDIAGCKL